jgi:AraC family ethanolamine operon transcriptional activator
MRAYMMTDASLIVRHSRFSDLAALRDAAQDAPSEVVQLERGRITGDLTHLSVGSLGISTGTFSRAVRGHGVLSKDRWTIISFAKPAKMQLFEVAPGDLFLLAPGHEHHSAYSGANAYASMFIEPDVVSAFLESQQPGAWDAVVWRQPASVVTIDPALADERAKSFQMLVATLMYGPALPVASVEFYRRALLDLMIAPVIDGDYDYRGPQVPLRTLVHEVDRFLVEADRPVHITELIEHFNVPRRTLHRAFRNEYGVGPIEFNRHRRLGNVHAVLLQGGPDLLVKDIARAHGFADYGRFSREYQELFGERAAHTLRRSPSWAGGSNMRVVPRRSARGE